MRLRALLNGKEVTTNNLPCTFCPNGTVDVKLAEKRFKDEHSVLARIKDKEKWLRKWADLMAKVKSGKITAYNFYFEKWQLNREYLNNNFETVTSTVSETVPADCNKCKRTVYLHFTAETEVPSSEAVQNRDLINLKLADETTMKRVAARMRMFPTYADFKKWTAGKALKKAAEIVTETLEKMDGLEKEEAEVARLIGVLKELPSYFNEKLRQRRFDLLQEVKTQLQVDKPHIGEIT